MLDVLKVFFDLTMDFINIILNIQIYQTITIGHFISAVILSAIVFKVIFIRVRKED